MSDQEFKELYWGAPIEIDPVLHGEPECFQCGAPATRMYSNFYSFCTDLCEMERMMHEGYDPPEEEDDRDILERPPKQKDRHAGVEKPQQNENRLVACPGCHLPDAFYDGMGAAMGLHVPQDRRKCEHCEGSGRLPYHRAKDIAEALRLFIEHMPLDDAKELVERCERWVEGDEQAFLVQDSG